jgi:DNA-binding winged helix-turn-helix (wHTH) protein
VESNPSRKQFGPFLFDGKERVLRRDGEAVPLTPKAFDLLTAFIQQPGRLLSKDELLKAVWPDTYVEESNLAYHVFVVRKALGDAAENGGYIETVPKRGYRFTATVTPVSPGADGLGYGVVSADGPSRSFLSWSARLALFGLVLVLAIALYLVAWMRQPSPDYPLRAVPLTSLTGAVRGPSLSPDGRFVVFTWAGEQQDNPDLYIQQIGAGGPHRLTTDPGNDHSPAWSPDGQAIAFLRRAPSGKHSEVWLIAPLGGSERKVAELKPGLAAYLPPSISWCPDSRCLLASDSYAEETPDAVYLISWLGRPGIERVARRPDRVLLAHRFGGRRADGRG